MRKDSRRLSSAIQGHFRPLFSPQRMWGPWAAYRWLLMARSEAGFVPLPALSPPAPPPILPFYFLSQLWARPHARLHHLSPWNITSLDLRN